jgi:hypothetical protein
MNPNLKRINNTVKVSKSLKLDRKKMEVKRKKRTKRKRKIQSLLRLYQSTLKHRNSQKTVIIKYLNL